MSSKKRFALNITAAKYLQTRIYYVLFDRIGKKFKIGTAFNDSDKQIQIFTNSTSALKA